MGKTIWEKIPSRREWLPLILPYLLLGSSAIWTLLFCHPVSGLHPVEIASARWASFWPTANMIIGYAIAAITLILVLLKAYRRDWFWSWAGTAFVLVLYLLTILWPASVEFRFPENILTIILWLSVIFAAAFVVHLILKWKHPWIWPLLYIPAIASFFHVTFTPVPDKFRALLHFSSWKWGFVPDPLFREGFVSLVDWYPLWQELAIVAVFALLVVCLIRGFRVRPEKIFQFSLALFFVCWLFSVAYINDNRTSYHGDWQSEQTINTWLNGTMQVPFLLKSIPYASSLIVLPPLILILYLRRQKKLNRRIAMISFLVITQFILLQFFPIANTSAFIRDKQIVYEIPSPFGSHYLGALYLYFHSYLDIFLIRPLVFVSGALTAALLFLGGKRVIACRRKSGQPLTKEEHTPPNKKSSWRLPIFIK